MKIQLITPEQHAKLLEIYNNTPALFLQNTGYEIVWRDKLSNSDKDEFDNVTEILKKSIVGFSKFSNFRLSKNKEIEIRFQYDWTAHDRSLGISFVGVGYILLDELLNGFRN